MEGVPRMPMLEIEVKQNSFDYSGLDWAGVPTEDVHEATRQQIAEGLKRQIKEEYGEDPEKYQEAINKLFEIQTAAYKAIFSLDFEGCNALKKYYGQLHYMQSRFPFTGDSAIKVTFAWQDSFTGILTVHETFTFEQTAILFNIGSIHSHLGAIDSRTTEEGIRISCVHFQCAAGLFSYISDHFDTTLSADISQSVLKLFINVMLAQGQECLLEKSMQDNRKSSIVSKISQQVVDYYKQCQRGLENRESESSLGSDAYKHWNRVIAFKIAYYSAITKYYLGNNANEQDKYGQAVAFFGAAVEHLGDATKLTKGLQKESRLKVEEAIKFTSDVLNGKCTSSVKDNKFVYHDKVPDKSTLPAIKGASLVKPLPFEPANQSITGSDIFSKLVPMEAHLAASTYSEEKAKLLRSVVKEIDDKDEILSQYKASIELDPKKLMNVDESSKLDQKLIAKVAQLHVDPSPIVQLKKAKDDLTDVYSQLDNVLNNILTVVEQEETKDQKLKDSGKKDIFSSQEDIDGVKKELQVYTELYHKASQMNEDLHTACRIHITNMKLVAGGMDSLRDELHLIDIAVLLTEEDKTVVESIHKLCNKVAEMEEQRKSLLRQLREQMEQDDVTSTLVVQYGIDQEDIFQEELKKHGTLVDTIRKNLSAQDNILGAVTQANARYTKIRKTVETERERVDTKVGNLVQSCDCFEDVLHKCEEGTKFFEEVLDKAQELLKRVQEFHKENEEKRSKINQRLGEIEKVKEPPPPRPTAPKPKIETQKKATPATNESSAITPFLPILGPDILAKMMAEDDDELLNDPEFIQFLQSQGDIHGGHQKVPVTVKPCTTLYRSPVAHQDGGVPATINRNPSPAASSAESFFSAGASPRRTIRPQSAAIQSPGPRIVSSPLPTQSQVQQIPTVSNIADGGFIQHQYNLRDSSDLHAGIFNSMIRPFQSFQSKMIPYIAPVQYLVSQTQSSHPQIPNLDGRLYNSFPPHLQEHSTNSLLLSSTRSSSTVVNATQHGQYSSIQPVSSQPEAPNSVPLHSATQFVNIANREQQNSVPCTYTAPEVSSYAATMTLPIPANQLRHFQPKSAQNLTSFSHQQSTGGYHATIPQQFQHQYGPQRTNLPPGQTQGQIQNHSLQPEVLPVLPNMNMESQNHTLQRDNKSVYRSAPQEQYQGYPLHSNAPADSHLHMQGLCISSSYARTKQVKSQPVIDQQTPDINHIQQHVMVRLPNSIHQVQCPLQSIHPASTRPSTTIKSINENVARSITPLHPMHMDAVRPLTPTQPIYQSTSNQNHMEKNWSYQQQIPSGMQDDLGSQTNNPNHQSLCYQAQYYSNIQQPGWQNSSPNASSDVQKQTDISNMQNFASSNVPYTQQPCMTLPQQRSTQYHVPSKPNMILKTVCSIPEKGQVTDFHPSAEQSLSLIHYQPHLTTNQIFAPMVSQANQKIMDLAHQPSNYTFKSVPHQVQYMTMPGNASSPGNEPAYGDKQSTNVLHGSIPTLMQGTNLNKQPMEVLTPTSINTNKPTIPARQPSSDLAGLILTPTRSLSTSADELLSTLPESTPVTIRDKNQVVLVPTKADEESGMVVCPVEGLPYMDDADLMKFKGQVVDFRSKVHSLLQNPEGTGLCQLDREWKTLSEEQEKFSRKLSTAVARCSSYKNRFQDVVPFDQSRVILHETKDDYINASVIDGVSKFCPRFIATQSSLVNTISDFWMMVFEQRVNIIVMLVNSKDVPRKCPIYWPLDRSLPQQHGPLTVSFTTSKTHGDLYVERTFTVKHLKQSLVISVTQLQYIAWPEHRLPSSASDLLTFISVVQSYHGMQRNLQCPILVHCESGVGRSGVFCALLAGISEINAGMGIMNVIEIVEKMRKKRKYMVQEKAQLKFVYDVILYHAVDVLKQRKVTLEDELRPVSVPQQVNYPAHVKQSTGQFDIFSDQSALYSIQATVDKMTVKPGHDKENKVENPMNAMSTKSCSDVPTQEKGSKVFKADDQSSNDQSYKNDSTSQAQSSCWDRVALSQPLISDYGSSVADLSDLVQGTMATQPQSVNSYQSTDIPGNQQNISMVSEPDIVESCSYQKMIGSAHTQLPNLDVTEAPCNTSLPLLIESLTPESFTLNDDSTSEKKQKRVTKEDFFKPSSGLISKSDPSDPFSTLDPLWGLNN